jgi:hypothetical protein
MNESKEIFKEYSVVVGIEKDGDNEYPVIEKQMLEESDMEINYEWVDDEHTILKPINFKL